MVSVTNTKTGDYLEFKGKLMVATNGVMFIKNGSKTVWASGSLDFVCMEK